MLLSVMHLRQAYHRDRGTQLTHCCCGSLRSDTRIGIGPIDMVFGRQPAGNLAAHSRSRGNDQWLPRTGDRYPHRFDESEEHTSELQSLMRTSYAVFCLKKKNKTST